MLASLAAILLHVILLAWSWLQLSPTVLDDYGAYIYLILLLLFLSATLCLRISLSYPRFGFVLCWVPVRFRSYTGLIIGSICVNSAFLSFNKSDRIRGVEGFNKGVGSLAILGCIVWFLIFAMKLIARKSKTMQRKILLLSEDATVNNEDLTNGNQTAEQIKDQDLTLLISILSWLSLIFTVLLSVLWYEVKYNPEGTFKPMWTDVLG